VSLSIRHVACTASVVVASTGLLTAPAAGASPSCGDVITVDTTLRADLAGCREDGLVIGADGIRLNLAGHRVEGDGVAGGRGIVVEGRHGVVIQGGGVTGLDVGVLLSATSTSDVRRLSVHGVASRGIQLQDGSTANRIEHNRAAANGNDGISFVDGSDANAFMHNTIADTTHGIQILGSARNVVRDNTTLRAALGIDVEGDHNRVVANRLRRATGCLERCEDCDAACATGIGVSGGAGNLVTANRITGSDGTGIRVNDYGVFRGRTPSTPSFATTSSRAPPPTGSPWAPQPTLVSTADPSRTR
jgi:parallel beta-helix repeat protein